MKKDFRDAFNIVEGELTPQPWEWTDPAGTTLTVIPQGLPQAPGCGEVTVKITASHTLAAEVGITTTDMPGLLAALEGRGGWEGVTTLGDVLTVIPQHNGGIALTVTQVHWGAAGREGETEVAVVLPEKQRLPLVSALRRATDVARGWEY